MTAREEEQMTTPIDELRRWSQSLDPDLAELCMYAVSTEESKAAAERINARLHATTAAPPDVREDTRTTARKIEDAIDNAFDTIGPRISAESVKRVVLAALPSAPVLPTRSQIERLYLDGPPHGETLQDEARIFADYMIAAGFAVEDAAALAGDQQGEG